MAQEGRNQVLFLTRDRLYLYDGNKILVLNFPVNIIHDLDVKDKDGFYNLVSTFIQNNKLVPAQLFFILSESVCFSKDFVVSATEGEARVTVESKEFIDTIPFSSVVSKIYKTANNYRAVGCNQDLIDTIFEAFQNKGFGVSALIPAAIFTEIGITDDLTVERAQLILGKTDMAIAASMVGERVVKEQQLATSQNAIPKNKFLPYLAAIFVVLLVVLMGVVIFRR